jgi:hypothetical protein
VSRECRPETFTVAVATGLWLNSFRFRNSPDDHSFDCGLFPAAYLVAAGRKHSTLNILSRRSRRRRINIELRTRQGLRACRVPSALVPLDPRFGKCLGKGMSGRGMGTFCQRNVASKECPTETYIRLPQRRNVQPESNRQGPFFCRTFPCNEIVSILTGRRMGQTGTGLFAAQSSVKKNLCSPAVLAPSRQVCG